MKKPYFFRLLYTLVLASFCVPASASIVYRMVDGTCTDSNHGEVFFPNPINGGLFGVGPKVCSDDIVVELRMKNSYIPGTSLSQDDTGVPNAFVESIFISDGARSVSSTFSSAPWGYPNDGPITGRMPVWYGLEELKIYWAEGWFFNAARDGSWTFGIEFGARDAPCGIGSTPGTYGNVSLGIPAVGVCVGGAQQHYYSIGTFTAWERVPEPSTLTLAAAALLGIAITIRRRPATPTA